GPRGNFSHPSPSRAEKCEQLETLPVDLVVGKLVLDPGRPRQRNAALLELAEQLFDENAASRRELWSSVGPLRPPAAPRIRARDHHSHRRAALEADHDDLVPAGEVESDGARDAARYPPAMSAIGARVVLLLDRPEAVEPGKCQLGARHLLDRPAALAQELDERRVDARA